MSKETKPLKYYPVTNERKKEIANIYKDYLVTEYIEELYNLIEYQMNIISEQRQQIIADKHKETWKQCYRELDDYNSVERRYFTKEELQERKCQ